MLAGLLPYVPSSVGRHLDNIPIRTFDEGFDSYRALKKHLGSPGPGMEWHHIVERSQIGKSGFSPRQIHNLLNVIAVPESVHRQISGYYASIRPFLSPGERVRDFLARTSFQFQYEFGLKVLEEFGIGP
jgi:hypothetical protein